MTDQAFPPRPRGNQNPSAETDFWAGLFVDLNIRVEWLSQALDAVPKEGASASALVRLRSYAKALVELKEAIAKVQQHRAEPTLKPLFSLEGPLAGYLSRLYAWCDEIGDDFERLAGALRREEPAQVVFSHKAVNESYARFAQLIEALRRVEYPAIAKELEEHIEELIWATEWVHMTLARRPGE